MSVILETVGLTKEFGALRAVDGVSLKVAKGILHAVIGPNGAGKTTLFNLITGELRPTAGRILFEGRDITGLPTYALVRLGLARSFQRTSVFANLTVFENVWLARFAVGDHSVATRALRKTDDTGPMQEAVMETLRRVGLEEKASRG